MPIPPLVFALDYRVKNENSFIRSVNLANKSQQDSAKSAEQAAVAQSKLEARYESTRYHVDRLRQATLDAERTLRDQHATFRAQEIAVDNLSQRYANWKAKFDALQRSNQLFTGEGQRTRKMLSDLSNQITAGNRELSKQQQIVQDSADKLRYVNIQLKQRVAREKELELQLKQSQPVQQQQVGFFASMRQSLAQTFSSWENLVNSIERFSVTADRLTRSGQRTINIINKISGAITGKPLLDWDKSATKATTSHNSFNSSVEKSEGRFRKLASGISSALNPIKNLTTLSVAAGTALGNLASFAIASVINGLRNMGYMAVMTAQNIARSAISNVSSFERTTKSLTALLAQEKAQGNVHAQNAEAAGISAKEGEGLRRQYEKMNIELHMQEQAFQEAKNSGALFGDELRLQEISLAENRDRLSEVRDELDKYVKQQNAAAGATDKTAKATGQVRDFLAQAGPEAAALVRWVEKLAIESPFDTEGVKNSFLMLKSFGFMADESKRMTTVLIDWASATGKTSAEMERVSLALSQIKNLGRLAGQDVLQLAQAGIAVDQILARSMNKSVQEVVALRTKGLIPAKDAIEAIIKQLETDWKGAAKDQAQTFSGLINSIQDIGPILLRNLFGPLDEATGQVGGIFGAIRPHIANFVDFLASDTTLNKVKEFGIRAGEWVTNLLEEKIPQLQSFAGRVYETFQGIANRVTPFIDRAKETVQGLFRVFSGEGVGGGGKGFDGLFKVIESNLPKAQQTFQVVFDTIKITSGELAKFWETRLKPAVQSIASLFTIDMRDASAVIRSALQGVQTISAKVTEVLVLQILPAATKLVDYVKTNFPIWKTTVEDAFQTAWKEAQPLVTAVQSLYNEVQKDFPLIQQIVTDTVSTIQEVWAQVTDGLPAETELSLQYVVEVIREQLEKGRQWWEQYGEALLLGIKISMKAIITVIGAFVEQMRGTSQAILLLLQGDWRGALERINEANANIVRLIKQTWSRELMVLRDIVDNIWRAIKLKIHFVLVDTETDIKNFLFEVYNGVRNRFLETLYAAENVWDRINQAIVKAWKDISYEVKSIYYGLENNLKLAWIRLTSEVRQTWEAIRSVIVGKWNEIYDKVMYYINLVVGLVTDPQKRQEFMEAARNWIQSMIETIRGKSGELYNAVVQMARQAVQGLYNVFRIGSPSKLGQDIADNLVGSISDRVIKNIPRLRMAIGEMTSAVNVPMGGSVNHTTTNNVNNVSNYTLNMTTTMPPHNIQQNFDMMRSLAF